MLSVRLVVREDSPTFRGVLADVCLQGLGLSDLLSRVVRLVMPRVWDAQAAARVRALTEVRELEAA